MTTKTADQKPVQKVNPSYWISIFMAYLTIPIILFACSGDLGWWQAWVYSSLIVVFGIGIRYMAGLRHPGLIAERAKFVRTKDVKAWDRVLSPLMSLSIGYPLYIVAGLDHRFQWSPVFPIWLNIIGLLLCAFGYGIAGWALVENRFFSSMVRIQTDRGHRVCDTGPYRFIRHPGYAGNLIPLAGIVLALSSLWALIPAVIALIITVTRTALEDRVLLEELPGYQEYARRVRYRLIPWVY